MAHNYFRKRHHSHNMPRRLGLQSPFVSLGKIISYKLAGIDVVVKTLDLLNGLIKREIVQECDQEREQRTERWDSSGNLGNFNTTIINLIQPKEMRAGGSRNINLNAMQRKESASGHTSSRGRVTRKFRNRRHLKTVWPKDSRTVLTRRTARSEVKSSMTKIKTEDKKSLQKIVLLTPPQSQSRTTECSSLREPKQELQTEISNECEASTSRPDGAPSRDIMHRKPEHMKEDTGSTSSKSSKKRYSKVLKKTKFLEDLPRGHDCKKGGSIDGMNSVRSLRSSLFGRALGKCSPSRKKDTTENLSSESKSANESKLDYHKKASITTERPVGRTESLHQTSKQSADDQFRGFKRPLNTIAKSKGGGKLASELSSMTKHTPLNTMEKSKEGGGRLASELASSTRHISLNTMAKSKEGGGKLASELSSTTRHTSMNTMKKSKEGGGRLASELSSTNRHTSTLSVQPPAEVGEKPASRSWAAVARGVQGSTATVSSAPTESQQCKALIVNPIVKGPKDPRDFPSLGETQRREMRIEKYRLRRFEKLDANNPKGSTKTPTPSQSRKHERDTPQLALTKTERNRRKKQNRKRNKQARKKAKEEQQTSPQAIGKGKGPRPAPRISWRIDDMREVVTQPASRIVPLHDSILTSKSDLCNRLGAISVDSTAEAMLSINSNRKRKGVNETAIKGYKSVKSRVQKDVGKISTEDNGAATKKVSTRYRALLRCDYGKIDVKTATQLFNRDRWMPSHQKGKIHDRLDFRYQRRRPAKCNNPGHPRNDRETNDPGEGTSRRVHWNPKHFPSSLSPNNDCPTM